MEKIELLAPALNLEVATAAINSGADAVYIGANSFGARKNASNSTDDIKKLIEFAHIFNVKVYVTVNTILKDGELKQVEKLINKLYEIKTDAIIIQDMGILELDIPPIELHASTQCNIRTLEKVKFLENTGFKRVVLARELSLEQIKEIKENTNIELECFIHGALCVCYSGQCYMSASLGSRSANRGDCAQACRMKYSLKDKNKYLIKDKYLLSLKDFNASNYLEELIKIGVKSFKIEGRLKDETYVKNTVLYYKNLLKKYDTTSIGTIINPFEPNINKTFNRGYTSYFLNGENNIYDYISPKSKGEYLGKIAFLDKKYFKLDKNIDIHSQDGLCFVSGEKLTGCLVNKFEGGKIYPNLMPKIKKGDFCYRNSDVEFIKTLKNSKIKRVIEAKVIIDKDKITLDDSFYQVSVKYEYVKAQNKENAQNSFRKSFSKSFDSQYLIKEIIFKDDLAPFLPISKINEIRRNLFDMLNQARFTNYKTNTQGAIKHPQYNMESDYRLNIYNKKAEDFYKKCKVQHVEYAPEATKKFTRIELMRTKHCLRRVSGRCLKACKDNSELFLEDEKGNIYTLKFDCKNCEMVIIKEK